MHRRQLILFFFVPLVCGLFIGRLAHVHTIDPPEPGYVDAHSSCSLCEINKTQPLNPDTTQPLQTFTQRSGTGHFLPPKYFASTKVNISRPGRGPPAGF